MIRTMVVEAVHCTVSETRSCAARRFCVGYVNAGNLLQSHYQN